MMTPPPPFCLCPPNPVYKDPLPPLSVVRLQDRFPVYPPPFFVKLGHESSDGVGILHTPTAQASNLKGRSGS